MSCSVVERLHARHDGPPIMVVVDEGGAIIPREDSPLKVCHIIILISEDREPVMAFINPECIMSAPNIYALADVLNGLDSSGVFYDNTSLPICAVAANGSGERAALDILAEIGPGHDHPLPSRGVGQHLVFVPRRGHAVNPTVAVRRDSAEIRHFTEVNLNILTISDNNRITQGCKVGSVKALVDAVVHVTHSVAALAALCGLFVSQSLTWVNIFTEIKSVADAIFAVETAPAALAGTDGNHAAGLGGLDRLVANLAALNLVRRSLNPVRLHTIYCHVTVWPDLGVSAAQLAAAVDVDPDLGSAGPHGGVYVTLSDERGADAVGVLDASLSLGAHDTLHVVDNLDHSLANVVNGVRDVSANRRPSGPHLPHSPREGQSVTHALSAEGGGDGVGGGEVDAVGVHVWAPFRLVILFIRRTLIRVNMVGVFYAKNFTAPIITHA